MNLAALPDPVPADLVRRLDPRWGSGPALARASRKGRGPRGRRLVTATCAVYPKAEVLAWLADRDARAGQLLAERQARAAHAREVLRAKRAAGAKP
mgnify:FL=1